MVEHHSSLLTSSLSKRPLDAPFVAERAGSRGLDPWASQPVDAETPPIRSLQITMFETHAEVGATGGIFEAVFPGNFGDSPRTCRSRFRIRRNVELAVGLLSLDGGRIWSTLAKIGPKLATLRRPTLVNIGKTKANSSQNCPILIKHWQAGPKMLKYSQSDDCRDCADFGFWTSFLRVGLLIPAAGSNVRRTFVDNFPGPRNVDSSEVRCLRAVHDAPLKACRSR